MEKAAKSTNHSYSFPTNYTYYWSWHLNEGWYKFISVWLNQWRMNTSLILQHCLKLWLTKLFKLISSRNIHQLDTYLCARMCMSRYNIYRIATQARMIPQQSISPLNKSNKQLQVVLNDPCQQFLSRDCRDASSFHRNSHPPQASLISISFCLPDPKYFQFFIQ